MQKNVIRDLTKLDLYVLLMSYEFPQQIITNVYSQIKRSWGLRSGRLNNKGDVTWDRKVKN
jgi:hypothetical protein